MFTVLIGVMLVSGKLMVQTEVYESPKACKEAAVKMTKWANSKTEIDQAVFLCKKLEVT